MNKETIKLLKERVSTQIVITKASIDMFSIISEVAPKAMLDTQQDHYLILDELNKESPSRNEILAISERISERVEEMTK